MNKKEAASQASIQRILASARKAFAEKGYQGTSLEDLAQDLGMTRGVLYHHYKNKNELFTAVVSKIQEEIGQAVLEAAESADDPWEQLVLGSAAFVQTAMQPDKKRILLIDGSSIIGWKKWKQFDKKNAEYHLKEQIIALQNCKRMLPLHPDHVTSLISGALNEFALYLAENQADNAEIEKAVRQLLKGFRT